MNLRVGVLVGFFDGDGVGSPVTGLVVTGFFVGLALGSLVTGFCVKNVNENSLCMSEMKVYHL